MKTLSNFKSGLKYSWVLLILSGFSSSVLLAQETKTDKEKKKEEKVMHVKVITKDDKGKITKFDTVYSKGDKLQDTLIVKKLKGRLDMKELEDKLKNMEITMNIEGDSLDSLSKEITAEIMMDDGMPAHCKAYMYKFNGEDGELVPLDDKGDWNNGPSCCPNMFVAPMPPQPPVQQGWQQGWQQGYTPWGKIRDIKVKTKRHGKKIVIRTEDSDLFELMSMYPAPPMPPVPPHPPKMMKGKRKIVIEKEGK